MECGIRLLSSSDIYKWDKWATFVKASACVEHCSLVRHISMVLSSNNFNENFAPAIMGAKSGVGWASTRENTEFLEEMAQGASAHKGILCGTTIFSELGCHKGRAIAWLLWRSLSCVSGIEYLRATDDQNNVHVALVLAKTKVVPTSDYPFLT